MVNARAYINGGKSKTNKGWNVRTCVFVKVHAAASRDEVRRASSLFSAKSVWCDCWERLGTRCSRCQRAPLRPAEAAVWPPGRHAKWPRECIAISTIPARRHVNKNKYFWCNIALDRPVIRSVAAFRAARGKNGPGQGEFRGRRFSLQAYASLLVNSRRPQPPPPSASMELIDKEQLLSNKLNVTLLTWDFFGFQFRTSDNICSAAIC